MNPSELRARFERSLAWAGSTHTVDDVVSAVRRGEAQFWHSDDACIVTELFAYPQLRSINFWLISGELRAALALEPQILEFAAAEGCEVATANGRRGWGRAAAPTGWRLHSYNYVKPLTGGFDVGRQE